MCALRTGVFAHQFRLPRSGEKKAPLRGNWLGSFNL
jgi:hypothetical protein